MDAARPRIRTRFPGVVIDSNGYAITKRHGHPLADCRGYVYEHRLVAEEMLGRPLRPGEVVHHINGVKDDNRVENLRVFPSQSQHVFHERDNKCAQGHELTHDNVVIRRNAKGEYRRCLTCERASGREKSRRRRARLKEARNV